MRTGRSSPIRQPVMQEVARAANSSQSGTARRPLPIRGQLKRIRQCSAARRPSESLRRHNRVSTAVNSCREGLSGAIMPPQLLLSNGATSLTLAAGQEIVLGRQHVRPTTPAVVMISKEQCRVCYDSDAGGGFQILLTSLGANPTLVLRTDGENELLTKGSASMLAVGDKIALLSTDPEQSLHRRQPPGSKLELEAKPGAWPVMMILVGAPGSGKSTFVSKLQAECRGCWVRVCQDVVKGGKSGSRKQCVIAARRALLGNTCVAIDRCNFDTDQRKDFLALAKSLSADVHVVFLKLPGKLVAARAVARTNHEGGVQGKGAAGISMRFSNILAKPNAQPRAAEGFRSVRVCLADRQVDEALVHWVGWTRAHHPQQSDVVTTGALNFDPQPSTFTQTSPGTPVVSAASPPSSSSQSGGKANIRAGVSPAPVNAFSLLMAGAKASGSTPAGKKARDGSQAFPVASEGSERLIKFRGAWCQHLWEVARDPARFKGEHPELQVHASDSSVAGSCVFILDKYPKARVHGLFISTNPELESIEDLRASHLPELEHMARQGQEWAEAQRQKEDLPGIQMGFHWIPSMRQLHLHVISTDFQSASMKNKKHWNSFTTSFFRPVEEVIAEVKSNGRIRISPKV